MAHSDPFREIRPDPRVRLLSVDIFDTLVLRRPISERRRHNLAAEMALSDPRAHAVRSQPSGLVAHARAIAQDLAHRELEVSGRRGEVRLVDVFRRQLMLLGLPEDLCSVFLAAEVAVEKQVLLPNRALIEFIGKARRRGIRTVGISDTGLFARPSHGSD